MAKTKRSASKGIRKRVVDALEPVADAIGAGLGAVGDAARSITGRSKKAAKGGAKRRTKAKRAKAGTGVKKAAGAKKAKAAPKARAKKAASPKKKAAKRGSVKKAARRTGGSGS